MSYVGNVEMQEVDKAFGKFPVNTGASFGMLRSLEPITVVIDH